MAQTEMNVELMFHTQMSDKFRSKVIAALNESGIYVKNYTDGQVLALTAIRTCYSPNKPTDIIALEGAKYFGNDAIDGKGGTDADRLIRQIVHSKHTSTLEGITFTFAIEGVSRSLLAQLTRHRVGFSFSVQSQRYVKFGSDDRSGGFDYVVPESFNGKLNDLEVERYFDSIQETYDFLRSKGVPAEDARAVLPNASACNLVMTANLRSLLDFYAKRKSGRGGQLEITQLAERLREQVVNVEPWTDAFFEGA